MKDLDFLEDLRKFYYIPFATALVAILAIDSWSFYLDVRWILCAGFVSTLLLLAVDADSLWWAPILGFFGIIQFNPVDLTSHPKGTWIIIDLVAAFYFFMVSRTIENSIIWIKEDLKREAALPKDYKEKEAKRKKQWADELDAQDKKILKDRARQNISELRIKKAKESYTLNPYVNRVKFTREELNEIQRKQSSGDMQSIVIVALIIAAIAYGWHIFKVYNP
jgi:hypothetical protein